MKLRKPLPKDPMIRQLVAAQLASRRVSRRSLITGIGTAGMMGALAACGTSGTATSTDGELTPAEDLSETEKQLFWANWTLYLDYDDVSGAYPTLERFQEETGIQVTYAEDIDGNETYYGKIQSQLNAGQDFGQDIVTLTDWMAARLVSQGLVQELDHANIPNLDNLLPALKEVDWDSGRNHSVTWQSGMAGIAWNKEAYPDGLATVSDLWQSDLRGRVTVLDEMRDTMGLIMLDAGVDITSFQASDFENAIDVLEENIANGQIRQVRGNSYKEDLVSGDALAAIAWSGDITQLNFEEGDKWEFAIPEGGATLWSDNLLVPMGATHKANAEQLINFYLDPEVAAEVAAYVNFVCPVVGAQEAMEAIDPELVDDPLIFPTDEDLQNVEVFRALDSQEESDFVDLFQRTIGN